MKLFYSQASPFVRKVLIAAHEKAVFDRIEIVESSASPINLNQDIVAHNPAGKVPSAVLDDNTAIYDSRVICAYVDSMSDVSPLLPQQNKQRFEAMTLEAMSDSITDALLLARYETAVRPEKLYWAEWYEGQMQKVSNGLDQLEKSVAVLDGPLTIGVIAAACTLGYLDFRYGHIDWRASRPKIAAWYEAFSQRDSMRKTMPPG